MCKLPVFVQTIRSLNPETRDWSGTKPKRCSKIRAILTTSTKSNDYGNKERQINSPDRVNPDSLKAISDTCDKFALDVTNQLTAHRNKQLERQKAHEQRIARMMHSHEAHITDMLKSYETGFTRMLTGHQGIWLSYRWTKILFAFLAVYAILIILFVKSG